MFTLIDTTEFPKRSLTARRFRHQCGLEVLSLETEDTENLFALCFNTPPTDSTGVAHIIEHSVLEGSAKYPVKDPFVCMLKGSVATFINAMTYSDRTIYPCCTCCSADYFNLFSVYWDAVFHPNLTRATFEQEGWHYEIKGSARRPVLKYNGIVLNEMSGYYSSPETILARAIEGGLFPDTPLRYDSGGAPAAIPSLTYNAFRRFHRSHYAPSVARIVLYGNIPTEEKLVYIEKQLSETLPAFADSAAGSRQDSGRRPANEFKAVNGVVRKSFTPDPKSARSKLGICGLAWALNEDRDAETDLAFQLLDAVLLGNSASPLSKAMTESKLGLVPLSCGYDNETKYTSFQVAMWGVKPENFLKFEDLILDTLKDIVKNGLDPVQRRAAVAAFQVSNQAITSRYVIGILEDILASWTYSDDPYGFLRLSEALPKINRMLESNPRFFEELIQKWLLDNPKRIRMELVPDTGLKKRQDQALRDKLARKLATWSPEKIRAVKANGIMLNKRAVTPDSPEAVATLPMLLRSDLPLQAPASPYTESAFSNGLRFRRGNIFDNGLNYFTVTADASGIPPHLVEWLPFFAALFGKLGTESRTYDQLSGAFAEIGASTAMTISEGYLDNSACNPNLLIYLGVSALDQHFTTALELLQESLDSIIFSETTRLTRLLKAAASKSMLKLMSRGNEKLCSCRAAAGLAPILACGEINGGLTGLRLLQQVADYKGEELELFCGKMREIAAWMRTLPFISVGFVGSDRALAHLEQFTARRQAVPEAGIFRAVPQLPAELCPAVGRREYISINAKVATCTRVMAAPSRNSADYLPLLILGRMLSVGYLWDEIRAKGGAYHAHFSYSPKNSTATLLSSSDPQASATYKVFDSLRDYLNSGAFNDDEAAKAAMAHAGVFLQPQRPASYHSALALGLVNGYDNARRQEEFAHALTITPGEIREAGLRLLDPASLRFNDCAAGPAPAVEGFKTISP